MADIDRRQNGGPHSNFRKRRYRDDDENDRRGSRRRFDPPPHVRIRKQLLAIAENPMRPWHEEAHTIGTLLTDNWDDELLRGNFVDLVLQLAIEQPLKTPFVAAVVLVANGNQGELVDLLLAKLAPGIERSIGEGEWRSVKLYLKLLACLQGALEDDGVFPILDDLFARAGELQTASSEDTVGTELVKIILLTLPYIMSTAPAERWQQKAADLMDKTEIIASEPHALQALVDPYHPENGDQSPIGSTGLIGLLQKQLQAEASNGWELACLPRPWDFPLEDIEQRNKLKEAPLHRLPTISLPETIPCGPRPLFPEIYFSVYAGQEVESVPSTASITASLTRDALLDTINIMHYNRNITARNLIELDCFFAPRTFTVRATPYDKLRDIQPPRSSWKPEDVAVDAVFSQLFQLPAPEHKLVYYHSVLTEACKLAPAAIAPSLGRAIRYLYRNINRLDLELCNRFVDWFSHHLSNFGFTWKWTEWEEDVFLSELHPAKAFIIASIDKEIRLSFAQRIKGTLPPPYLQLISPEKERDIPVFKFAKDDMPFALEGREIATMLKNKASDDDIQPVIDKIHSAALDMSLDPLVSSTDVFVTAVLHVGNKSLSHVLAAIERTKDRLLNAGAASDAARGQIISAVMAYWAYQPGIALSIVEKLLNYGILSPLSVIQWALLTHAGVTKGRALAESHIHELVFNTVIKVTSRVRQVVRKAAQPEGSTHMDVDDGDSTNEQERTRDLEVRAMRELFRAMDDALVSWASGTKDELIEDVADSDERQKLVARWGERWLRVFRRRAAIEEAFVLEAERNRVAGPASGTTITQA